MEMSITVAQTVNVFMVRETVVVMNVLVELIVPITMVDTLEWIVGQMCVCLTPTYHHNQHLNQQIVMVEKMKEILVIVKRIVNASMRKDNVPQIVIVLMELGVYNIVYGFVGKDAGHGNINVYGNQHHPQH